MVKFLIYRPVSVFSLYIGLVIVATFSISKIPISLLPNIDVPEINILIYYNGHSAREIENAILSPLRNSLLQLDRLDNLNSTAYQGYGVLKLRFSYKKNMDYALFETNELIDQSLISLPREVERPRVIKGSTNNIPILNINLSLKEHINGPIKSFSELSQLANNQIRRRIEQLEEVAIIDITGTSQSQIMVTPNEESFLSLGINQQQIQKAFEDANLNLGSITIQERQYEYILQLGQSINNLEELKNIPLKIENRILKLKDIANVVRTDRSTEGLYISGGQKAISLLVIKNADSRTEQLSTSLDNILQELQNEFPQIQFKKSQNQASLLSVSINNLKQSLIIAGILAMIIIFLFYRNWRIPLIIGLVIPVGVLLSLLFFFILNISINIISLSGIIIGLGLMIDNGIIVLDNIIQFNEGKEDISLSCIKGTNEMIRPLLSSMLSTCAVFLPLLFLSGIGGALFKDQAIAISIGLVISYIVSITLLPTLYFSLFRNKKKGVDNKSNQTWSKFWYDLGFKLVFKYPILTLLSVFSFSLVCLLIFFKLRISRMPELPQRAFEAYIEWNENILPSTGKNRVSAILGEISNISYYNALIGEQRYIYNFDPEQTPSSAHVFIECGNNLNCDHAKEQLKRLAKTKFPNSSLQILPEKTIFEQIFPTQSPLFEARMMLADGGNDKTLISEALLLYNQGIKRFPNTSIELSGTEQHIQVIPQLERLLFYDLDMDILMKELERLFNSRQLSTLRNNSDQTQPIMIGSEKIRLEEIYNQARIQNANGDLIPLYELIEIKEAEGLRQIHSSKEGAYLPIKVEGIDPTKLVPFFQSYEKENPSVRFSFEGDFFRNRELVNELLIVLGISILLLYFIMSAQFESLILPLVILLEIPISIGGCLLFLFIGGSTINVVALIGIISTVGIVINDSIVKIDTITRIHRTRAYNIKKAIHIGGLKRLNPIIMTSLTTILSVLPFLFGLDLGSKLQQPLALTLIGGLLVGTLVSLYIIPLLYSFLIRPNT